MILDLKRVHGIMEHRAQQKIAISAAKSTDSQIASRLIYLAMGSFADFIFGFGDSSKAISVLARLFSCEGNRFSYQFANFAKTLDGNIVGIVLAYPCREIRGQYLTTARQLPSIYGVSEIFPFLRNILLFSLSIFPPVQAKQCKSDEYYISTLAVLPEFQGINIGTALIAYAEDKARRIGFKKSSLGVAIENDRAIRFYKHRGYRAINTTEIKYFSQRIGSRGFYRMVKTFE